VQRSKRVIKHGAECRIDDMYEFHHGPHATFSCTAAGIIYKAKLRKDNTNYAIKQVNKDYFGKSEDAWRNELELLMELDNPNIAKIFELWEDEKHVYLVMEYCRGGNIGDLHLRRKLDISEGAIAILVRQMVSAVCHLHQHGLVHGHVCVQNFLFSEPLVQHLEILDMVVKLIDYGLTHKFTWPEEHKKANCDSKSRKALSQRRVLDLRDLTCKAPEQLEGTQRPVAGSDIWALGVVTFYLICGRYPFTREEGNYKYEKVKCAQFDFLPKDVWSHVSHDCKRFISLCLQASAEARPSAINLMSAPWMAKAANALLDRNHDLNEEVKSRKMHCPLDAPLPSATDVIDHLKVMHKLSSFQKIAMTTAAHRLPTSRLKYVHRQFEIMDTNGDGVLTAHEMYTCLESAGLDGQELLEILKDIDTDADGVIEYTEFVATMFEFQKTLQESTAWSVFRVFDQDSSGNVSKKEIKQMLCDPGTATKLENSLPNVSISSVIREFDKDGDGQVGFEEFRELLLRSDGGAGD